jgi:hypothetical protein
MSVVLFAAIPDFPGLFSMAMGVYDDQGNQQQPAHQQYNDHRLMLPDLDKEAGEIFIHGSSIYTGLSGCQMLFAPVLPAISWAGRA